MKTNVSGDIVNISMSHDEFTDLIRSCGGDLEKASDILLKKVAPVLKVEVARKEQKTCKDCRWFGKQRTVIGYPCENPKKEWRSSTAQYKFRSARPCKMFKEVDK